jgi:hypothetical protein
MLKHKTRVKKQNARLLGTNYIVECKVYVPRGQVNTSFFNILKIVSQTDSFYLTESVPLIELQIVRNHLAKARGESEWSFEFLYNADQDKVWLALGITDPDQWMREYTELFIKIIQKREDDYKTKMENRKKLMAERRKQKQQVPVDQPVE